MRPLVAAVISLGWMSFSAVTFAQTVSVMDLMDEAVSGAPGLQMAQADIARAHASAKRIAVSPYEYQVSVSAGQRFIDDPLSTETRFTEYGAGLSKTIRLPSKKRLDQRLSEIEVAISELGVEVAAFNEKKIFIELWSAWSQAHWFVAISRDQAEDAAELAALELAKVEKGAGRQINADILLAQSHMTEVMAQRDFTAAQRAKLNLQSRYPLISLPADPLGLSASFSVPPTNEIDASIDHPAYRLALLQS